MEHRFKKSVVITELCRVIGGASHAERVPAGSSFVRRDACLLSSRRAPSSTFGVATAGRIRSKHRMSKSPMPAGAARRRAREPGARDFELFDDLLPVRRYKLLLQTFLNRRGSGSRQAIAEALGNTRSFVTQMTSPAYDLAIPAQHVRRIIDLVRLEPEEQADVPRCLSGGASRTGAGRRRCVAGRGRTVTIQLPVQLQRERSTGIWSRPWSTFRGGDRLVRRARPRRPRDARREPAGGGRVTQTSQDAWWPRPNAGWTMSMP